VDHERTAPSTSFEASAEYGLSGSPNIAHPGDLRGELPEQLDPFPVRAPG
jgi:hypothetical protein